MGASPLSTDCIFIKFYVIINLQLNSILSRVVVENWLNDPTATCKNKVLTPTQMGKMTSRYISCIIRNFFMKKTAEFVSPKHSDKICDFIADSILDAYLQKDKTKPR